MNIERTTNILPCGGVVLCGGKSSRMGSPKAWLEFGDQFMLQRVVGILQSIVHPIVVVAANGQELPELPEEVEIARDEHPGKGPLAGIACGLKMLGQCGAEYGFVTACDTPFLRAEFVKLLFASMKEGLDIILPTEGKFQHVLSAIYRTSTSRTAEVLLSEERLRPLFLTEVHPTHRIDVAELSSVDPELDSLKNLNTLEDYQVALRRLERNR